MYDSRFWTMLTRRSSLDKLFQESESCVDVDVVVNCLMEWSPIRHFISLLSRFYINTVD